MEHGTRVKIERFWLSRFYPRILVSSYACPLDFVTFSFCTTSDYGTSGVSTGGRFHVLLFVLGTCLLCLPMDLRWGTAVFEFGISSYAVLGYYYYYFDAPQYGEISDRYQRLGTFVPDFSR